VEFEKGSIEKRLGHPQFEGGPISLLARFPGSSLAKLEDPIGQVLQEVFDYLGAGRRTGGSIRHHFAEEESPDECKNPGKGELGKATALHPLLLGDILPLKVIPVEFLEFLEKMGTLHGRERGF
jgi:hypothetical protein